MPVINWILNQQIQLGMILCACLFVPWGQRRSCFVPRLAAGVWAFLALTDTAFLGSFQSRFDFLNALGWLHGVHGVF